ncbi:MAG: ATP-binding protein [Balneolales bacterium]|nr:ATP-binding protein [Balneolales bacterium]
MTSPNLRTKALIIAAIFAVLVIGMSVYFSSSINQKKENIIAVNTEVSIRAMEHFSEEIRPILEQVWRDELEGKEAITRKDEREADSLLSAAVKRILKEYDGIEGGIYFYTLDEFIGYAYPSIPSPKPVFGPPPRSYNIIRDQVRASILEDRTIVELHGFDPATFPLSTKPIEIDGENVAALWTRVHIARELAATGNVTRALINMTLIVTLLGFIIALAVSWKLKHNLEEIRDGLERIKSDNTYRLPEKRGLPGYVSHYINDLITNLFEEQQKREILERELNQKKKMATLGKMIAGVAHEINTPISIIKTRVQIWERQILKLNGKAENQPVSIDSMELVRHEIDRVSKLVKRLLVFSRPVSERKHVFDLMDVIRERVKIIKKNQPGLYEIIQIENCDDAFPIYGDANAIEQVLINVLNNSYQAGAEHVWIRLVKPADSATALLEIEDDGSGISEASLDKIFDPFYTTKDDGTGLGLSISYEIIRAHSGKMVYRQAKIQGTVCSVELPLTKKDEIEVYA